MWLHIPSAFVGSAFAGTGFLLIHRELSHRRRLTTKWEIQEYVEAQWKEIRKGAADSAADSSKVSNLLNVFFWYLKISYTSHVYIHLIYIRTEENN